jgi:hypothetical protein
MDTRVACEGVELEAALRACGGPAAAAADKGLMAIEMRVMMGRLKITWVQD